MIIYNFCDQKDCILHPAYIDQKEDNIELSHTLKDVNSDIILSNHIAIGNNDTSIMIDNIIRIKTSGIDIPFECTICSHFKKLDMKEILIVQEARKVLND